MFTLDDSSLEWSLIHLNNFYDSDFYPKPFEFDAIKANWTTIKAYIQSLDLEKHIAKTPVTTLAPKSNRTFRAVHQLDPIDSIIYTALVHQAAEKIEKYRIPSSRDIACSYRISPDTDGSFFRKENGYTTFMGKADRLAQTFKKGHVLVCDIADFYNQIYLHRVNNVLSEADSETNDVIETFLKSVNTNNSRGIPVGPAPSILIAEAILADIDLKILTYTENFTRYVDDIFIFCSTFEECYELLHNMSLYLYQTHRLIFTSEKTRIISSGTFRKLYVKLEDQQEKDSIIDQIKEMGSVSKYSELEKPSESFEKLNHADKVKVRSKAYKELFERSLALEPLNLGLVRHVLRQAAKYNVRSIVTIIFENFNELLPALREVVIYFNKVLNAKAVETYRNEFELLLENEFIDLPYINIWIFTLFQNEVFNEVDIKIDYSKIQRIRERALIAKREKNKTWIKDIKNSVDTLGPWDKRAVFYASSILAKDEMGHWLGLESKKSDFLTSAVCNHTINLKKTVTSRS